MISIYSPDIPLDVTRLMPTNGRFDGVEHAQQVGKTVLGELYARDGDWIEVPIDSELPTASIASSTHELVSPIDGPSSFRSIIAGGSLKFSFPQETTGDYCSGEIKLFEWDPDINTIIMTQQGRNNRQQNFATAVATVLPLEELLDREQKIQFAGF